MAAYHDPHSMDGIFRALADPGRRRLLDSLNARNGQTLRELCADMDMARQSVSKHLAVLEEANLVSTVWRGREKLHYLNAAPITEISERWIDRYEQPRVDALTDLKHALENPSMDKPSFVYTTYIQTTPERLWEALTSSAFTERYWSAAFETDWTPGSRWSGTSSACGSPIRSRSCSRPTRPGACPTRGTPSHPSWPGPAEVDEARFAAASGRAPVQGDLRDRAGRQRGEAHRRPRRVPG